MTDDRTTEEMRAGYNWTQHTNWQDITSLESVSEVSESLERGVPVVPTGISTIDRSMMGLGDRRGIPQGTYMIVGGASNIGKTQFGLRMLLQAAGCGHRTGLLSLDMRRTHANMRMYQALAPEIPSGTWLPSQWNRQVTIGLEKAMHDLKLKWDGRAGIAVYGHKDRSLQTVTDAIREGVDAGATFFVVDHIQKIQTKQRAVFDRAEEISETLDWLAEKNEVTICALSQLNRTATQDRQRKPSLADLWGGTAMESNAGVVIICDHSRYKRDPKHHEIGRTFLLAEKNQFGPKGFDVAVRWNHATLQLDERNAMMGQWPGDK